jgi:hypothetical protein
MNNGYQYIYRSENSPSAPFLDEEEVDEEINKGEKIPNNDVLAVNNNEFFVYSDNDYKKEKEKRTIFYAALAILALVTLALLIVQIVLLSNKAESNDDNDKDHEQEKPKRPQGDIEAEEKDPIFETVDEPLNDEQLPTNDGFETEIGDIFHPHDSVEDPATSSVIQDENKYPDASNAFLDSVSTESDPSAVDNNQLADTHAGAENSLYPGHSKIEIHYTNGDVKIEYINADTADKLMADPEIKSVTVNGLTYDSDSAAYRDAVLKIADLSSNTYVDSNGIIQLRSDSYDYTLTLYNKETDSTITFNLRDYLTEKNPSNEGFLQDGKFSIPDGYVVKNIEQDTTLTLNGVKIEYTREIPPELHSKIMEDFTTKTNSILNSEISDKGTTIAEHVQGIIDSREHNQAKYEEIKEEIFSIIEQNRDDEKFYAALFNQGNENYPESERNYELYLHKVGDILDNHDLTEQQKQEQMALILDYSDNNTVANFNLEEINRLENPHESGTPEYYQFEGLKKISREIQDGDANIGEDDQINISKIFLTDNEKKYLGLKDKSHISTDELYAINEAYQEDASIAIKNQISNIDPNVDNKFISEGSNPSALGDALSTAIQNQKATSRYEKEIDLDILADIQHLEAPDSPHVRQQWYARQANDEVMENAYKEYGEKINDYYSNIISKNDNKERDNFLPLYDNLNNREKCGIHRRPNFDLRAFGNSHQK